MDTIEGLTLTQVGCLADPQYLSPRDARDLLRLDLLHYRKDQEDHWRTDQGEALWGKIRSRTQIVPGVDAGGERWHLDGEPIHCGAPLDVLLPTGEWLPCRFEVAWIDGKRHPRIYVHLAGGHSMVGIVELQWAIVRWPERND